MLTNSLHSQGRHTIVMSRLATALKNESTNIDVAVLSKKYGKMGDAQNSHMDIVEITDIYNTTDTPAEEMDDLTKVLDLASYVKNRNQEIRESIPKHIPPEIVQAFLDADPHKEEIERNHALAAKARPIRDKLKSGKQLEPQEMDFLKEHYPELYAEAKQVEAELKQFRSQMKNANTTEEKNRVITQKMSQIAAVAKTDPGHALCMMAAITEEIKNHN